MIWFITITELQRTFERSSRSKSTKKIYNYRYLQNCIPGSIGSYPNVKQTLPSKRPLATPNQTHQSKSASHQRVPLTPQNRSVTGSRRSDVISGSIFSVKSTRTALSTTQNRVVTGNSSNINSGTNNSVKSSMVLRRRSNLARPADSDKSLQRWVSLTIFIFVIMKYM